MIDSKFLKERFKHYTDDDLHDRRREIRTFGGNEAEQIMIELESERRSREQAATQKPIDDKNQVSIFDYPGVMGK